MADLSKIGIEGLESYSNRKLVDSQAQHFNMLARKGNIEADEAVRMQELGQLAAQELSSLARGGKSSAGGQLFNQDDVDDDDMAAPLEKIGEVFLLGGATEQGAEYFKTAADIRKKQSDITTDTMLTEQRRLENIIKGSDIVARQIGTAKNQAEWDAGLDNLEGIMEPENIQKLRELGFNPNAAAFFREKAISAADQARLDLENQQQSQQLRIAMDTAARDRTKIRLQEQRDADNKDYRERLLKITGAKNEQASKAPSPDALRSARTTLKNMVFKDAEFELDQYGRSTDKDFEAGAEYVAAQAQALLKANPAMNWDTAVRRAVLEGQAKNVFGIEEDRSLLHQLTGGAAGKKKTKATFDGASAADALPMPAKKEEMQKGKYYITARGRAIWNGTSFDLAE